MKLTKIKIGDIFSRLTVTCGPILKYNKKYWGVVCVCGTSKNVAQTHLKSGATKSCGCLSREKAKSLMTGRISPNLKPDGYSAKYRFYIQYRKGASDRKYDFELTLDEFIEITSKNCAYCDSPPLNKIKHKTSRSVYIANGIDRVDNSKGYIKTNVVPCCKDCNFAKRTMTPDKFYDWARRVVRFKEGPYTVMSDKCLWVDVDDTLVVWEGTTYRPHTKHIEMIKKFYNRGQPIFIWSAGGWQWARRVVYELQLERFITAIVSKPAWWMDDLTANEVLFEHNRIYFKPEPVKGLELKDV